MEEPKSLHNKHSLSASILSSWVQMKQQFKAHIFPFFKKDFIYLTERETVREGT